MFFFYCPSFCFFAQKSVKFIPSKTLSAVLDIKGLREFQKQPVNDKFKKTPPDYSANMVKDRERKRFLFDPKNKFEDFLTDLTVACMEYMPVWK